jgi:hypothetical protein
MTLFRTRRRIPSGSLPRRARGLLLGGLWLRCLTWARALDLDHALARGADPMASDGLSLRAGQLRSLKARTRLACSLEAVVELADGPPPVGAFRPLVRRREAWRCRALLVQLAKRLADDEPLNVQGMAMCSELLRDGGSPLFYERAPHPLADTVRLALAALDQPADAPVHIRNRPDVH